MAVLGKLVVWAALCVVLCLIRGFALSDVWQWFVVPLGVTPIVFWHAHGLSALSVLFTSNPFATEKETKWYDKMVGACVFNLVIWGVAWVYHVAMINNFLGLN